jgi:hypothetical protein
MFDASSAYCYGDNNLNQKQLHCAIIHLLCSNSNDVLLYMQDFVHNRINNNSHQSRVTTTCVVCLSSWREACLQSSNQLLHQSAKLKQYNTIPRCSITETLFQCSTLNFTHLTSANVLLTWRRIWIRLLLILQWMYYISRQRVRHCKAVTNDWQSTFNITNSFCSEKQWLAVVRCWDGNTHSLRIKCMTLTVISVTTSKCEFLLTVESE